MRRIIYTILGLSLLGVGGAVPSIPTPITHVVSYETMAFNTSDGDIGINQYAVYGNFYVVRRVSKDVGNFTLSTSSADIVGKSEVTIACEKCRYYEEFFQGGKVYRYSTSTAAYNSYANGANRSRPDKVILEPLISSFIDEAEAAVAVDANSGTNVSAATSFSYTHTPVGTPTGAVTAFTTGNGSVSSVTCTYGGSGMTLVGSAQTISVTNSQLYVYKHESPASGAQTVACSWTTARTSDTMTETLTGSGTMGTPTQAESSWTIDPTTKSDTVTIATGDLALGVWIDDKANTATADTNQTDVAERAGGGYNWLAMNYTTGSGSVTLSATESTAGAPNGIGWILVPIAAPAAASSAQYFDNVITF